MKIGIVIVMTFLFYCSAYAQFSFAVLPGGEVGDPYADTMLNSRAILLAAGVRQVNTYQTLAEVTKTYASKKSNLDRNGRIENMVICFEKRKEANLTFCIYDTITYDNSGHIVNIKSTDSMGNNYPPIAINHINEHEVVIRQDSSTSYQSYNEKGQLVTLIRTLKGQEIENTRFYYNSDGLLDSTYNTNWGTFIFKRRNKGKDKLIEMENGHFSYRWVYNPAGQCIGHTIISKDQPNVVRSTSNKGNLKSETRYFYNQEGTLSRITTRRSGMPVFTVHYTYVKF